MIPERTEVWKDVVGYEGIYQVSNNGRVRSMTRIVVDSIGIPRKYKGRILSQILNERYYVVSLCHKGDQKNVGIHSLVLESFVGPRPEGMEACHFPDRDVTNNRLENLRWDTHLANQQDKIIHGTSSKGEKNCKAKVTEDIVRKIRSEYIPGITPRKQLAEKYGIHRDSISAIVKKRTWSHVL